MVFYLYRTLFSMCKFQNSPNNLRTPLTIIKIFYEVKFYMCVALELPNFIVLEMEILLYLTYAIKRSFALAKFGKIKRSADFPHNRCYTLPIGTRVAKQSEESAKGRHRLIFFYVWNTN